MDLKTHEKVVTTILSWFRVARLATRKGRSELVRRSNDNNPEGTAVTPCQRYPSRLRPDGHQEFALGQVPSYCHSLPYAPPRIEPELENGTWLILLVAVWSIPDRAAIDVAIATGRDFGGKIQIGIRPFNHHHEAKTWCPQMQQEFASPVWLLLCDGQLIAEQFGSRGKDEMISWIEGTIRVE